MKLPTLIFLLVGCTQASNLLRGVPPHLKSLYTKNKDKFACLDDPNKIFDISVVNDNYCDCKDGSDEPGTSACPNTTFYCENKGHVPGTILSSRVNDGICDDECCDGSDEYDGKVECPNRCKEVGEIARKKEAEEKAILNLGLEKKQEYIKKYDEIKKDLNKQLEELKKKVQEAKNKVEEVKKIKENKEAEETRAHESKQANAVARADALEHHASELKSYIHELHDKISHLEKVLKDLKENHNQNYHDMAVKGAITAYESFIETYEPKDIDNDERFKLDDPDLVNLENSQQGERFGFIWNWIEHVQSTFHIQLSNLRNYLSNLIYPSLNPGASDARSQLWSAESELRDQESELEKLEAKLNFDLGHSQAYGYLIDKCFNKDEGEYTYTVCMFGDAHQKSKNGENIHLGKFSGWSETNPVQQDYTGGTYCWNGPQRSVKLFISCGTEDILTEVTEPEKCEYHIKMKTPAACQGAEKNNNVKESTKQDEEHDEL